MAGARNGLSLQNLQDQSQVFPTNLVVHSKLKAYVALQHMPEFVRPER